MSLTLNFPHDRAERHRAVAGILEVAQGERASGDLVEVGEATDRAFYSFTIEISAPAILFR